MGFIGSSMESIYIYMDIFGALLWGSIVGFQWIYFNGFQSYETQMFTIAVHCGCSPKISPKS
jgi:hypothetical protein